MPAVSVVIVNYNGAALLDDCLSSLKEQQYRDFEVVFVDNGSKDGSCARARELLPEARVIELNENTGFAKGNNIGIAAAAGKYIVLLNNDTKSDKAFLAELVRVAEADEKVGMVAPKILNFFDTSIIDSVGGLLLCRDGIGQGRGRGQQDRGQLNNVGECLMPSGCAALYRKAMLDEIGLLDENFFAYCEDSDLGLRAVWAGWKTVAAPKAVTYHKYSASSSAYSPFKLCLVERNHYFLALKNFPKRMLLLLPFWSAWRYCLMAYAVLGGKGKGQATSGGNTWALLKAFIGGHWQALLGAPRCLQQRPRARRISSAEFSARLKQHRIGLAEMILNE